MFCLFFASFVVFFGKITKSVGLIFFCRFGGCQNMDFRKEKCILVLFLHSRKQKRKDKEKEKREKLCLLGGCEHFC